MLFTLQKRYHRSQAILVQISRIISGARRTSSASKNKPTIVPYNGRCELDSHADTLVAGRNCVVLGYTGNECEVQPYREDYDSISNVPIATVATAWQSPSTGQCYILVFNEALWMGYSLPHSLINPNQLRHFGVHVQDDPSSSRPLSIITADGGFSLELSRKGTVVYFESRTPTEEELSTCPHVVLTSQIPWDPTKVYFPSNAHSLEEEVERIRRVGAVDANMTAPELDTVDEQIMGTDRIFHLSGFIRCIAAMKVVHEPTPSPKELVQPSKVDDSELNTKELNTFQSSERHTDVSPQDLSERWNISIQQATATLKKTTQRFIRSAVLPLSRRYRADRMFKRKTLDGKWATDTMDGRCKSLDGNRYAQVFTNDKFFSKIYPMDSKSKAGDALRVFCEEFGVPQNLTFDGSKEQTGKNTPFMKEIRKHFIDYHIAEEDRHNQSPAEGVIREIRKKWYRTMIRRRVPQELWDYGISWCSETSSLTYSNTRGFNFSGIPRESVTGETEDISEYLDFGFYDRVWYKDNAGLSPSQPGRWLGVSKRTGRLMCYHVLTQKGSIVSRSTVQRVTHLELQTETVRDTFKEFDDRIRKKFKMANRGYDGSKPNPEDWADLFDNDPLFDEEFRKVYNNMDIPEADDVEFTPETMNDTYLNMEVALPKDGSGPEMARVTKRLRDRNGIPIGVAHENPLLDTRVYEVEYLDGKTASLSAKAIAENLFSQVDEEGHRHVLFDSIIDHRTTGKEIKRQDAYVVSSNGGKRHRQTTKGWEILLQWKDGSTTWETLKDIKNCYPVQLADYAIEHGISNEPAFKWWIPYVIKKRNRIIAKIKTKYWARTHKFGIRIPKSVKEAKDLDQKNGNTLWWEAICMEMKNVRIAFEEFDGDKSEIPKGYQYIDCHIIFDIKMGENFRRKARMVAGGHKTQTPNTITYSSVVSRDSVRIALTLAALNGLSILGCDIQNAYLTAPCRENIWTIAGPVMALFCGSNITVP